jgi:hypothetical protein
LRRRLWTAHGRVTSTIVVSEAIEDSGREVLVELRTMLASAPA